MSCLAEQAKILLDEGEENNLVLNTRWLRWTTCSLCEQEYHGVVRCALGWVCWKTYVGRPEVDALRGLAMNVLGNGLYAEAHHEDELSVREAQLSMLRRVGASEERMLVAQSNIAGTFRLLGRLEQALRMR